MILKTDFYRNTDVCAVARSLLGKLLVTEFSGVRCSGIITETEAYDGPEDKASHAYGNRRTSRTEVMFAAGGLAYVYLCYGMHHLFNVVTGALDKPQAVLIRSIRPLEGVDLMLQRRKMLRPSVNLSNGPGKLSSALGIDVSCSGMSLLSHTLHIETTSGLLVESKDIVTSVRIGIDYAQEHVSLPYRFYLKNESFISKK